MPETRFRQATLFDVETVSSISRKAYEPAYLELIGDLPRPATEDYGPWITGNSVWICDKDDEAVGVLVIERNAEFWTIWSIAVDPIWQGQGFGMLLIEKAVQLARTEGVRCVQLHTNSRMEANLALYRKAGFYRIDVKPHPGREGHELVYLQRDIVR